MFSRTWHKKIPPVEGFLLFLSGTARGCLVLPFVLLFIYVSNNEVTWGPSVESRQTNLSLGWYNVISLSRLPPRLVFWWRFCVVTLILGFFCRCRGFCHRTESDLFLFTCDILSPSTEICQSGSNTGTWFYQSVWCRSIKFTFYIFRTT